MKVEEDTEEFPFHLSSVIFHLFTLFPHFVNIDVHFYSISKDLAGQATRQLVVPERSTLAEVLAILFLEVPPLAPIRNSCLYAVGLSYAPMNTVLSEGNEISIIPPMQGG
jgi:molybdopterin converting factor small subunit